MRWLVSVSSLLALSAAPTLAWAQGAPPPAAPPPSASPPPPGVPPLGAPPGMPSGAPAPQPSAPQLAPAPPPGPAPQPPPGLPAPFGAMPPGPGPAYGPGYGYAPPSNYGMPPQYAPIWPAPRYIYDYEPGEQVPPGYHVETRAHRGLVIGGAVTFSSAYLLSILGAVAGATDGGKGPKKYLPLLIPAAGPFVTIGTANAEGTGTALLMLDGLAQVGGVVLFIVGMSTDQELLVRNDVRTGFVPRVDLGPRSGSLTWKF